MSIANQIEVDIESDRGFQGIIGWQPQTTDTPQAIKTTSLAGGLFTAYKAAVTSLALKGPLIKI